MTHSLHVPDETLAFDESGKGPFVICVPSMGDVRGEYYFLTPLLVTKGYHVVTLDVRGHEESSVNWPDYSVAAIGVDILALIRHLHTGPSLIVGASMAAGVAVWAGVQAPDLIIGMVLIGPLIRDVMTVWQTRLLFGLLLAHPWGAKVWRSYYGNFYLTAKPPDFTAYRTALYANLRESGHLAALHSMIIASKRAVEERLAQVRTPVLVGMGSKDPDFTKPEQEAMLVAQRLHDQVQMIEGAGHYPHAEMPVQVSPLIMSFFEQVKEEVSHEGIC